MLEYRASFLETPFLITSMSCFVNYDTMKYVL